jgi:hypothetical protein
VRGERGSVSRRDADSLAKPLTAGLSKAASVTVVVEAVAKAHRHRSVVATGWPLTRWLRRFRSDPLRRLHLRPAASEITAARTSLPAASAVQTSQLDTAVRDVGAALAEGVPEPWASAVRHAARAHSAELADQLDKAVATTSLGAFRRPMWWRVIGALQWLLFAAAVAGALWLLALFALGYLLLPEPPTPTLGRLPWPTALLLGGALAGVVIALLSRVAGWLGGRRRARKAAKALRASVDAVGRDLVLRPAAEELARYHRFAERLAVAQTR